MNINGRAVVKALMRPFVIIQVEIVGQASKQSGYGRLLFDGDVLVLDGSAEALHEDVVKAPATAVHTDTNIRRLQFVGEVVDGELDALVGVEDLRLTMTQRKSQGIKAEGAVERIGPLPGDDKTAESVHDGHQTHEAQRHRHVSDVMGVIIANSSLLFLLEHHTCKCHKLKKCASCWSTRCSPVSMA